MNCDNCSSECAPTGGRCWDNNFSTSPKSKWIEIIISIRDWCYLWCLVSHIRSAFSICLVFFRLNFVLVSLLPAHHSNEICFWSRFVSVPLIFKWKAEFKALVGSFCVRLWIIECILCAQTADKIIHKSIVSIGTLFFAAVVAAAAAINVIIIMISVVFVCIFCTSTQAVFIRNFHSWCVECMFCCMNFILSYVLCSLISFLLLRYSIDK